MLSTPIEKKINQYHLAYQLRDRYCFNRRDREQIEINHQSLVHFCSNDYLNIATDPRVKKAFGDAAYRYGLGSSGSNHVSGYFKTHYLLEEAFSEFLNRDRALFFNSGYLANLAVMSTFANNKTAIFADKYCHASIIDGMILSKADYYRYRHHDIHHASQLIENNTRHHKLLVTESVFGIEGTIIPAFAYTRIAKKYSVGLMIDDAHGFGVLGKKGAGICDYFNLSQDKVPCLITPFGKALGSCGAMVSGHHDLIEALLQFARSYRYTTALPPALSAATLEGLNILKQESWRRESLFFLSNFFNHAANDRGIKLLSQDATPIKCIVIGNNKKTLDIQHTLFQKGFFVSCIRPPTVPIHTARIKITLNCLHTENQIIQLLDEIKKCL